MKLRTTIVLPDNGWVFDTERKVITVHSEDPIKIRFETPSALIHDFHCGFQTRIGTLPHQLVLEMGWIECDWDSKTGFITGMQVVPGDPNVKGDLDVMDWIQTKDPRKQ